MIFVVIGIGILVYVGIVLTLAPPGLFAREQPTQRASIPSTTAGLKRSHRKPRTKRSPEAPSFLEQIRDFNAPVAPPDASSPHSAEDDCESRYDDGAPLPAKKRTKSSERAHRGRK